MSDFSPLPEPGAQCGSAARWDLWRGSGVTPIHSPPAVSVLLTFPLSLPLTSKLGRNGFSHLSTLSIPGKVPIEAAETQSRRHCLEKQLKEQLTHNLAVVKYACDSGWDRFARNPHSTRIFKFFHVLRDSTVNQAPAWTEMKPSHRTGRQQSGKGRIRSVHGKILRPPSAQDNRR